MEYGYYKLYLQKYNGYWDSDEFNADEVDKLNDAIENADGNQYCWYIVIGYTQYTPETIAQGAIYRKDYTSDRPYQRKKKRR